MPLESQSQRRFMHWAESVGKVPAGTAARWEAHTPPGKLPERVGGKPKPGDNAEKKAFVRAFLIKCAVSGVTTPAAIAAAAETYAAYVKAAGAGDVLGSLTGAITGAASYGPAVGVAAPLVGGAALGALAGGTMNQSDKDDAKTLRLAAIANAYRRRAAEAKTTSQVRRVLESDPSRYVVLG